MKGHPQRRYFKFSNESAENLLVPLREEHIMLNATAPLTSSRLKLTTRIYSGSVKNLDVGSFCIRSFTTGT